ncbi:L-serine ammonia-lyase, iron-sulfur-dependent subunit beta [Geobacillus sp. FSL K6-0789]|uniref:L-serine deaminase n=1 Tax=Geobacillus stearothermophilus TaxID=1422 RepID=A0A087LC25_GEOSE|nr:MULTISPECIES: L-serine ammonia-lyase, iron-sulfur-dependent subunit beta [Geobacillus]ATA59499.1 serine dehydratase [Geobacillus stearothermophilus]KAF6512141.1 L-serine dehydratase beta subunit [Geobacillus stearothermophilus]KFL15178.1 serine dehydratase [Geobacillus stearothermophilus]KFX36020.1 serine dehydratase [Geobacillus stearothermophilus]KMY57083.1 serine dehydratase [Geobacillus stearothermophilus]
MKYKSVFDIIGPVMVGPSSSHTAGAARIGLVARKLFGRQPEWAHISFYGSFAETYRGHGTDVAIVAGLLGFDTFDERIPDALAIAQAAGMDVSFSAEEAIPHHPNTARVRIGDGKGELELVGVSIGGGKIEIIELNGFELKLSGHHPALLIMHNDRYGTIGAVASALAKHAINIGHMEVSRKEKGKEALMTIEVDQPLTDELLQELEQLPNIIQVTKLVD